MSQIRLVEISVAGAGALDLPGAGEAILIKPYYQEPGITIYHADCRDILPHLDPVDLILTDPQYGIGFDVCAKRKRKTGLNWAPNNRQGHNPDWIPLKNRDKTPFNPSILPEAKTLIFWGANNYASKLPDSRGWIVWDKLGDKKPSAFGDCELAWSNLDASIRIHRQLWRGIIREGEKPAS